MVEARGHDDLVGVMDDLDVEPGRRLTPILVSSTAEWEIKEDQADVVDALPRDMV